ncbi:MAG: hypothetical protein CL908_13460 [Deltaproteobacteria bacterium]|nr:hypothetical protein [Deltaproteobacteria bacterium]
MTDLFQVRPLGIDEIDEGERSKAFHLAVQSTLRPAPETANDARPLRGREPVEQRCDLRR